MVRVDGCMAVWLFLAPGSGSSGNDMEHVWSTTEFTVFQGLLGVNIYGTTGF